MVAFLAYGFVAIRLWDVPSAGGIPFPPLWMAGTIAWMVGWQLRVGPVTPTTVIAGATIVGALLTDLTFLPSQGLRDLGIYVKAGQHFLSGERVYLDQVLTSVPVDRTNYPYLYPPLTLPVLAVLASLPAPLVQVLWAGASIGAALLTFRLVGIPARWWIVLLAWPPVFQGVYVGNVVLFAALLFVAAPWWGAGLIVGGVFKGYSALAGLWLVRERAWRAIVVAVAVLGVWTLVTLPFTGIGQWRDWIDGLQLYSRSQPLVPGYLYGNGLARYVPEIVVLVLGLAALAGAWLARGLTSLARFGIATIVISPSLFAHGFIVALPAFLSLRPVLAWLCLGLTTFVPGANWFAALAVAVVAWFVPCLGRSASPESEPEDLLAGAAHAWPASRSVRAGAPERRA